MEQKSAWNPDNLKDKLFYTQWSTGRVEWLENKMGKTWFKNKKVLDLGCGHGHVGMLLFNRGAKVICTDARQEFLDAINVKCPKIKTVQADLDVEWPFDEHFDMILHFGLLYHLLEPAKSIQQCCASCDYLILDTKHDEKVENKNIVYHYQEDVSFDMAYNQKKLGSKFSTRFIENELEKNAIEFERIRDAEIAKYANVGNLISYGSTRSFWFAKCRQIEETIEE